MCVRARAFLGQRASESHSLSLKAAGLEAAHSALKSACALKAQQVGRECTLISNYMTDEAMAVCDGGMNERFGCSAESIATQQARSPRRRKSRANNSERGVGLGNWPERLWSHTHAKGFTCLFPTTVYHGLVRGTSQTNHAACASFKCLDAAAASEERSGLSLRDGKSEELSFKLSLSHDRERERVQDY